MNYYLKQSDINKYSFYWKLEKIWKWEKIDFVINEIINVENNFLFNGSLTIERNGILIISDTPSKYGYLNVSVIKINKGGHLFINVNSIIIDSVMLNEGIIVFNNNIQIFETIIKISNNGKLIIQGSIFNNKRKRFCLY